MDTSSNPSAVAASVRAMQASSMGVGPASSSQHAQSNPAKAAHGHTDAQWPSAER